MKYLSIIVLLTFIIKTAYSGEKDLYDFHWLDPDKVIYVLQNKLFENEGSLYLNAGYGVNDSSTFQTSTVINVKTGFFFAEEWGIEAGYSLVSNEDSAELPAILKKNATPAIRRIVSEAYLMALFAPFYAKINTFNRIFYFDVMFGAGVSKIEAENNLVDFRNENSLNRFKSESLLGYMVKATVRLFITEHIHADLEYQKTYYDAEGDLSKEDSAWRDHSASIFSLGFRI
jgi:outer membrane beta-barrel protein